MKYLLSLLLLTASLLAQTYEKGSTFDLTVKDQFDKPFGIDSETRFVILATSKDNGKLISAFIEEKGHALLDEKKIRYFSDVSSVPSFVMSLFMLPKFEDYPYKLGLIREEEEAKRIPVKEDYFTLLGLKNGVIESIHYLENTKQLEALLK